MLFIYWDVVGNVSTFFFLRSVVVPVKCPSGVNTGSVRCSQVRFFAAYEMLGRIVVSNRTETRRRGEDRTARVSMKITVRFLAATRRSNILLRLFPGIGITSAVLWNCRTICWRAAVSGKLNRACAPRITVWNGICHGLPTGVFPSWASRIHQSAGREIQRHEAAFTVSSGLEKG